MTEWERKDAEQRQQRHRAANDAQSQSPASRKIVREVVEGATRELGIDLNDMDSVEEFRDNQRFVRELRKTEDFWGLVHWTRAQKKTQEGDRGELRSGLWKAFWTGLAMLASTLLGALGFSKLGGH